MNILKISKFSNTEISFTLPIQIPREYDIIAIAQKYKYNDLANWLIQNRTKYKNLDKMITRYEQCPQFAVMEWCFYLGSKTQTYW